MARFFIVLLSIVAMLGFTACSKEQHHHYRLLIYYGTPMGVNNVWNLDLAASLFADYDYIIFGDALNDPMNPHHPSTIAIMKKIRTLHPDVLIFGYVNVDMIEDRLTLAEIVQRIDNWQSMGVDGIFLDCMGYDYEVSRERQNAVIEEVHNRGMPVFVNAWNPDDVMGNAYDPMFNPMQTSTKLEQGDYYLLEKFLLPFDVEDKQSPSLFSEEFMEKMRKALLYRMKLGVKLLSVSRIDYNQVSYESLIKFFKMNEAAAGAFSLDGYGISSVEYGASEADKDIIMTFPYMSDYMKYYNMEEKIKYDERLQQYTRRGFVIRSKKGDHHYQVP